MRKLWRESSRMRAQERQVGGAMPCMGLLLLGLILGLIINYLCLQLNRSSPFFEVIKAGFRAMRSTLSVYKKSSIE